MLAQRYERYQKARSDCDTFLRGHRQNLGLRYLTARQVFEQTQGSPGWQEAYLGWQYVVSNPDPSSVLNRNMAVTEVTANLPEYTDQPWIPKRFLGSRYLDIINSDNPPQNRGLIHEEGYRCYHPEGVHILLARCSFIISVAYQYGYPVAINVRREEECSIIL